MYTSYCSTSTLGDEVKLKKFKFRLEVVLEMRQRELEKRQQEMAEVLKVIEEQRAKLVAINDAQKQTEANLEKLISAEEIDITMVNGHRNYVLKLVNDAKNQENVIHRAEQLLELKKKEVQEAYKKVKSLEKLKENQEKQYMTEIDQMLAKEIDDIAVTRYRAG